jgi:PAS domain S-box-containing protein
LQTNRKLQQRLGYSAEEFHSLSVAQVTHPEDLERDWHLFAELVSGKRDSYQIEKRYYRKDGSLVWGNLTVSLVRDDRGEPLFGIAIVEAVTVHALDCGGKPLN